MGWDRRLLTGSAVLFGSSLIVNAGNYASNLVLARWLGPIAFADVSLIVTIMLIITTLKSPLQVMLAKYAATSSADGDPRALVGVRRRLGWGAWLIGLACLLLLVAGAPLLQVTFQTESPWPFVLLGLGLPVFFVQSVDRGTLQGQLRFGLLALSYQAEMWVRLIASLTFVAIGWSVSGAVGALTLSFIATWLMARRAGADLPRSGDLAPGELGRILTFGGSAGIALIGQVLINYGDVLIVKHFFDPESAGLYAALALLGRIAFFATWSVATTLLPVAARKHERGEPHRHLLLLSLGLVAVVSAPIVAGAALIPGLFVTLLFGTDYQPIERLLWPYALATTLSALANVIAMYWLSTGDHRSSVLVTAFGLGLVATLWMFHETLTQVVLVQLILLAGLLATLSLRQAWAWIATGPRPTPRPVLASVGEPER